MAHATITHAGDVEQIATRLILEYHPHLIPARILYLFTDAARSKAGRVVLGSAKRLSALEQFLTREDEEDAQTAYDFIILMSSEEWQLLTPTQREALVDHELMHCTVGKNGWALRGHDVEEFREIIERHGFWKQDLQQFADAVEQLRLPA